MKRLSVTITLLALLAAFAAPSVSAEDEPLTMGLHSVGSALLNYVPNRANDVMDILHASVGFGLGYGVSVRATSEMALDLTDTNTLRFGFNEGGVLPQVWDEDLSSNGAALGPMKLGELDRDPAELGVGLHVGLIGADAAVDCYEVVDALLGLFMVDISEDDEGPVIASRSEPY